MLLNDAPLEQPTRTWMAKTTIRLRIGVKRKAPFTDFGEHEGACPLVAWKTMKKTNLALLALLIGGLSASASASDAAQRTAERALLLRQQQGDETALRMRQTQEELRIAPGDARSRGEVARRHLVERQRLETLNANQRSELNALQSRPRLAAPATATVLPRLQRERDAETARMGRERYLAQEHERAMQPVPVRPQPTLEPSAPSWGPRLD